MIAYILSVFFIISMTKESYSCEHQSKLKRRKTEVTIFLSQNIRIQDKEKKQEKELPPDSDEVTQNYSSKDNYKETFYDYEPNSEYIELKDFKDVKENKDKQDKYQRICRECCVPCVIGVSSSAAGAAMGVGVASSSCAIL